jgi:hypothetical protein
VRYPALALQLYKVGATSGWTGGRLSRTCVDVRQADSDIVLLCQSFVEAAVMLGDSGGPVFELLKGNRVVLEGINWGGDPDNGTVFIFSPIAGIEADLGKIDWDPSSWLAAHGFPGFPPPPTP